MKTLIRFVIIGAISLLVSACSSFGGSLVDPLDDSAERMILGGWYYHLGRSGFLLLDLGEGGLFSLSIISDEDGTTESVPGGKWTLSKDSFVLEWQDGTVKEHRLISVSEYELHLGLLKRNEVYYREPVRPAHNKKRHSDACGAGA